MGGARREVVLFAACVVALQIHAAPKFSPIDEMVLADYMTKLAYGHMPRTGEYVAEPTLREDACRGSELAHFTAPPCDSAVLSPTQFPAQADAYDSATAHPPVYYFITGLGARVLQTLLGLHSIVSAGRLMGILWLAAGLALVWLLCNELTIGLLPRLIVLGLVIVSPAILNSTARINNDAPSLLIGGAV